MSTLSRILSTAAAALALGASTAAADPLPVDRDAFRVPAGQIEHTVTTVEVHGSRAAARHERNELYLSRTRAHMVVRDAKTNRLRTEVTWRPGETRIYDAETDTLRIHRDPADTTPPYGAAAGEASVQRALLERGITRVVGEKLVGGRRALIVESVPGRWAGDEPASRTTAVVDAETFHLHERETTLGDGVFVQTERHVRTELLAASRSVTARLAMRAKPGMKIRRTGRR